jgi:hypothetical protein
VLKGPAKEATMRTLSLALLVTVVGCGSGAAPGGTLVGSVPSSSKADGVGGGYQMYGVPGGAQAVALDADGIPTTRFTWTMDAQQNTSFTAEDLTSGDQLTGTIDAQGNPIASSGSLTNPARARFDSMLADLSGASAGGKADEREAACEVGSLAFGTGCVLLTVGTIVGGFTALASFAIATSCTGVAIAEISTCQW